MGHADHDIMGTKYSGEKKHLLVGNVFNYGDLRKLFSLRMNYYCGLESLTHLKIHKSKMKRRLPAT